MYSEARRRYPLRRPREYPGGQTEIDWSRVQSRTAPGKRASTCRQRPHTAGRPCALPPNPAGSVQTGPCAPAGQDRSCRPSPAAYRQQPRESVRRLREPCRKPTDPARSFLHLHAQLVQTLDGGIAGEEVRGRGPKVMIFRFFTPMMARAIGMNSRIISAHSSAVPTGYSGM